MASEEEHCSRVVQQPLHNMISRMQEVLRHAESVEEQMRQLLCEKNEIEEKYQSLQAENEQLKKDISVLKSSGKGTVENVFIQMEKALGMAKEELMRIEGSKNHQMVSSEEERQKLFVDLGQLNKTNKEQNDHLIAIQEEKGCLAEHGAILEEQLRASEQKRRTNQSDYERLQNKFEEQNSQLRITKKENDALEASVAAQREELISSEEKMQVMRTDLDKAQTTVQELQDQLTELLKEKVVLEETVSSQKSKLQQMHVLEEERQWVQSKYEDLQNMHHELTEKLTVQRKKNVALDELLATQGQESHSLEQEKEDMRRQLVEMQRTSSELDDHIQTLMKEKNELEIIVSNERHERNSSEKQKLELHTELETLRTEFKEERKAKQAELEQFRHTLEENVQLHTKDVNQREQLSSLEEEKKTMSAEFEKQDGQLRELLEDKHALQIRETSSIQQMRALEEERRTMQTELEQMQKKYKEQNEQFIVKVEEIDTLEERAATMRHQMNSSEKEIQAMRTELEMIKTTSSEQTDQLRELRKEKYALEETVSSLNAWIRAVEEERLTIQTNLDQLTKAYGEQAKQLREIRKDNDALDGLISSLRQKENFCEKEIQALRRELETMHTTCSEQKDQLLQLRKEKDALEKNVLNQELKNEQIHALEEDRQTKQTELEKLNKKHEAQKNKLTEIAKEKVELEQLVETQRREISLSEQEKEALRTELEKIQTASIEWMGQREEDPSEKFVSDKKSLVHQMRTLKTDIGKIQKKCEDKNNELRIIKEAKDALEKRVANQRKQIGLSESEMQKLRTELIYMQKTSKKQTVQIEEIRKQNDALEKSVESKNQQIHTVEENQRKKQLELEQLHKKYEYQCNQIREITEEKCAYEKVVATKTTRLSLSEREKDDMQKEIYKIQTKVKEQLDQQQELLNEKEALVRSLEQNKAHYKETYESSVKENEKLKSDLLNMQGDESDRCFDHTPVAIAKLYKNVYTSMWRNACEKAKQLTFTGAAKNGVQILLECVQKANIFCEIECDRQKRDLEERLKLESVDDFSVDQKVLRRMQSDTSELTLGLHFEAFNKSLSPGFQVQKFANSAPDFVRECIRIFWLMNLHDPPIVIHSNIRNGDDFDENFYEAYGEEGDKVEYVVWPALLHGGFVLAKGVAKCYRLQGRVLPSSPMLTTDLQHVTPLVKDQEKSQAGAEVDVEKYGETPVPKEQLACEEERQAANSGLEHMLTKYEERNPQLRLTAEESSALEANDVTQGNQYNSDGEEQAMRIELEKVQTTFKERNGELREVRKEKGALEETVSSQKESCEHDNDEHRIGVEDERANPINEKSTARSLEPNVETYGDDYDQANIRELYKQLYERNWMEAFEEGKKMFGEQTELSIVSKIIEVFNMINELCTHECDRRKKAIREILNSEDGSSVDRRVLNQLGCDTSDLIIDCILQNFQETFEEGNIIYTFTQTIPSFIRECIRICWLMNLHEPPIVTQQNIAYGSDFDGNSFNVFTVKGDKVEFVVWPALILYEGGPLVAKGVVQCFTSNEV